MKIGKLGFELGDPERPRVPEMLRVPPAPAPWRSAAATAASRTFG